MQLSKLEVYSATDVARNFSQIAGDLQEKKRAFVMKNNKFLCVMLSCDEYEKLSNALTILEAIYKEKKQNV